MKNSLFMSNGEGKTFKPQSQPHPVENGYSKRMPRMSENIQLRNSLINDKVPSFLQEKSEKR